ncbi:type II secretion system protein F [Gordonia sp. PKS22-38]|uniref:Type II secretion system protein F n=1 Tax=Gordonia prachuapensis TaxID=3115651 RepID=A0ABU7MVT1_9ACTN|nr:type II secretion system protein F [Gordonia sp. PKS22-38]
MTSVLLAVALGVLWWPSTRAENRLARLGGPHRRGRIVPVRTLIAGFVPVAALVAAGVAAALSTSMMSAAVMWHLRRTRRSRRHDREVADLLRALSVMIAELSVGATPPRACASAAAEIRSSDGHSDAVADGLAAMASRAELGGDVVVDARAGHDLAWHRIAVSWQMADRHGLPMIELLESARSDLLARQQFAARTRAGLAGPRATATVLAGLPVIGVILGQMMGADPLTVLLGGGVGGILLNLGTVLSIAGWAWSQRITDRAATR